MQPPEPLRQLREYIAEARREIAVEAYSKGSTTFDNVVARAGRINHLEGLVSGYLEAIAATRPDLAREAVAEVQRLVDDIHAITLTAPGPVAAARSSERGPLTKFLWQLSMRLRMLKSH